MDALVKMLKEFFSTVGSLVDFIVDYFADLAYVIRISGQFLINIPSYFTWLPEAVVSVLIIIFGVVVIYMILGKE